MIKETMEKQNELIEQVWEGTTTDELNIIMSKWNNLSFTHKGNILKVAIPRARLGDPRCTTLYSLYSIFTDFRSLLIHPSVEELKKLIKILREDDLDKYK